MFRGLLIVLVTLVVLIAALVGVVRAGLHRIAAAQQQADANWHRPAPEVAALPATKPSVPDADVAEPARTFESIDLLAADATVHGSVKCQHPEGRGRRTVSGLLTDFHGKDDYAEWSVNVPKAGEYEIDMIYDCPQWELGHRFKLKGGDIELTITTEGTGNSTNFRLFRVGKLTLPAGNTKLSLRGTAVEPWAHCMMNLRSIQMIPTPATGTP